MALVSMATSSNGSRPLLSVQKRLHPVMTKRPAVTVSGRSRSQVVAKASMADVLDTFVTYGALSISVGATVYTLFYNWPGSLSDNLKTPLTDPEDNFTWGLMGAVSAFPLFNYMAWVLGALQSDNPRPYHWAAALYALPLLRNGLDQDWFSWALLLLGVAHIQALRIAATEPETQAKLQQQLKPLALVAAVAGSAGKAVSAATGLDSSSSSSKQPQQLGAGDDRNLVSKLLQGKGKEADEEDLLRQLELEEFDRRLQESPGKQQQQQQKRAEPLQSDWD